MSDKRIAIVSCGSMRPDIRALIDEGLKVDTVFFTDVCLKERSRELERQLKERLREAAEIADHILVIYGNACFVDMSDTSRTIDSLIAENGSPVERIREHSCVEMMLSETEKEELADGLKTYWMMPAWLEERDNVFFEWDLGKRNQTFPANDIALMVDAHGFFDRLMEEDPETILEFSDWMGLPLDSREIDLSRFGRLVREALGRLER
jgi:Protein of unknown function (DUF1638)